MQAWMQEALLARAVIRCPVHIKEALGSELLPPLLLPHPPGLGNVASGVLQSKVKLI